MYKKTKFILVLTILLLTSSLVYAQEDLDSLRNAINSNSGMSYLRGNEKAELMGISRDIFNIVRVVVVTALLLRIFRLYGELVDAAVNPSIKAKIKTKATWLMAGLVFTINFWNIYNFLANLF